MDSILGLAKTLTMVSSAITLSRGSDKVSSGTASMPIPKPSSVAGFSSDLGEIGTREKIASNSTSESSAVQWLSRVCHVDTPSHVVG
jgi:hypothetical protein